MLTNRELSQNGGIDNDIFECFRPLFDNNYYVFEGKNCSKILEYNSWDKEIARFSWSFAKATSAPMSLRKLGVDERELSHVETQITTQHGHSDFGMFHYLLFRYFVFPGVFHSYSGIRIVRISLKVHTLNCSCLVVPVVHHPMRETVWTYFNPI